MDYAVYGPWPVIAGAVWNGRHFIGLDGADADELLPEDGGFAIYSVRSVWRVWSRRPHAILTPVTGTLTALRIPMTLLRAASELPLSPLRFCPIVIAPDGTTAFVLGANTGAEVPDALAGVVGLAVLGLDEAVPLPPTVTPEGTYGWWTAPSEVGYRLGDLSAVLKDLISLREILREDPSVPFDPPGATS